jgi:hypothetical protein
VTPAGDGLRALAETVLHPWSCSKGLENESTLREVASGEL